MISVGDTLRIEQRVDDAVVHAWTAVVTAVDAERDKLVAEIEDGTGTFETSLLDFERAFGDRRT